jgi:hypothetical protein
MEQLNLFTSIMAAYATANGPISNTELYGHVADAARLPPGSLDAMAPVGAAGKRYSLIKRQIRWHQQTAKQLGLLRRVPGRRGAWELAKRTKNGLHEARQETKLVAFSTRLGMAIFGRCETALAGLDQPITLVCTSPPYLLRRQKAYGGIADETEYVDFICRALDGVVAHLAPGGSICLNVTNDSFMPNSPARSLYRERLVLALCFRFSLFKLQRDDLGEPVQSARPVPVRVEVACAAQLGL